MIAAVAKLVGVDKWIINAVAALLLAGGVAFGAWWIHSTIYNNGYAAAVLLKNAEISELRREAAEADANEQRRQTIANNAAKAREAAAIAALESAETENEELRRRLASEAQQDPDAGRPAIGAGGVRRINQIR